MNLFGEADLDPSCGVMARLFAYAKQQWPEWDDNEIRTFMFFEHPATQNFLRPLLIQEYGSIDAAKVHALNWLDELGTFETIARSTRFKATESAPARVTGGGMPKWYDKYLKSKRFQQVKIDAEVQWKQLVFVDSEIRCHWNHRHAFEVWHHADYTGIGTDLEPRLLVPTCHACHVRGGYNGPRLPHRAPAEVQQWI